MKDKHYVIVRTYSAGVHAGTLESRTGKEATLTNTRRLWFWDCACSLSQLALEGVKNPENCKFSVTIPEIILTEVIEIMPTTPEAEQNIKNVPIWKK